MLGYVALAASVACYAVGIVTQSVAAQRAERRDTVDPGLLVRLATDRLYLLGVGAELAGFAFAFFARGTLPLYLVQAGISSAVGLAALIGAVVLKWRIRLAEIGVLVLMAIGLLMLVGAAKPSPAAETSPVMALLLVGVLVLVASLAIPVWRASGPVPLGVLAGAGFAVVAIASRPVASGPLIEAPTKPLAWVMVAAAIVGQTLFAAALQRGSATATVAPMDAVTVLIASVVGVLLLGDQIAAGLNWLAGAGLLLVIGGVLAMAWVSGSEQGSSERGPEPEVEPVG